MNTAQKLSRDEKLQQRCDVLAAIVKKLRRLYRSSITTRTQRDLLETIIGAAIWYLPECDGLYTGEISSAARNHYRQQGNRYKGLTKEHRYPRKRAGWDLLLSKTIEKLDGKRMRALYRKKYGRYNYVTKEENRKLVSHQRKNKSSKKCHAAVRIRLCEDKVYMRTGR